MKWRPGDAVHGPVCARRSKMQTGTVSVAVGPPKQRWETAYPRLGFLAPRSWLATHSSIRLAIWLKGVSSASAICHSRLTVGLMMPRSTRLIYVRSNPHSPLRRSCEWPACSRSSRTTNPTALALRSVGCICLWPRCINRSDSARLRRISQRHIRLILRRGAASRDWQRGTPQLRLRLLIWRPCGVSWCIV